MCRHGAPSPTLSNPLEIGGMSHGVPDFKGGILGENLLHPFAGFGFATDTSGGDGFATDTNGGGGAASSCTVADTAGCLYGCRRAVQCCREFPVIAFSMLFAIGADAAERAAVQSCL